VFSPAPGAPDAIAPTAPEAGLHLRTRQRHTEIHALFVQGRTQTEIQQILGYDYRTVRRYLHAERPEDLFADAQRGTKLAAFTDYLNPRWNAGATDAEVLTGEITEQGYDGSSRTVRRYLQSARDGITPLRGVAKPPKTRDLAGWIGAAAWLCRLWQPRFLPTLIVAD
jgi:transposase